MEYLSLDAEGSLNKSHHVPEKSDQFVEYGHNVAKVFSVFLLVIGYICNPVSVAVLSRKPFRNTPMSVYLRFVAICDSVAILAGLVSIFRLSVFGRDIFKDLNICRLYYWSITVSMECSSWTLMSVTVERVISIAWPHKVKVICSIPTSKAAILLIFLVWGSLVSYLPIMVGHLNIIDPTTNKTFTRICVLAHSNRRILLLKYFLDIVAYGFLPTSVLVICNVIIMASVVKSRNRVVKICNKETRDQSNGKKSKVKIENENSKRKNAKIFRSKKEASLTVTLVCINTSYIICNLPVIGYQMNPYLQTKEGITPRDNVIFTLLYLLMNCNNVLNFLLYFLTGSKFRHELKKMLTEIRTCSLRKQS